MAYSEMTTVWGNYVSTGTGQRWCVGVRVYEETSWRTSTRCYLRVQCVAWSSGAMDVHANGHVTATNDSDGWWEGTFSNSAGSEFTFYQWDTWYGRDTSARSVSFGATFNVTGGFGNGSSSATATVTLPAKPSWTVSYSANGGSGAPSSQTKWAGDTLTLSNTVPTRANYGFLGWATSSGGAASYQPGDTYATDAALALYAVWRLLYTAPALSLSVQRVASATATDGDPSGEFCLASWTWSVDATTDPSNKARAMTCRHRAVGGAWADAAVSGATSGTSGGCTASFAASATSPHEVEVTVTDATGGSTTRSARVGTCAIPLDVANAGRGVGILAAAPSEGVSLGPLTLTGMSSGDTESHAVSALSRLLRLSEMTTDWAYLWKSSSSAGDYVRWRMLMGVVYLEVCHVPGVGSGGWKCGTLPASARLPHDLYHPMACWHDDHAAMAWVGGSNGTNPGEVWLYNNGSNHMYGMASWSVYNS